MYAPRWFETFETVNAHAPGVNTPMYRSEGQLRSTNFKSVEEQDRVVSGFLPLKVQPLVTMRFI